MISSPDNASDNRQPHLTDSVRFLKGVGEVRAALLARLGILTVEDLVYFFPRRYEDRREVLPLKNLHISTSPVAVRVRVVSVERRITKHKQIELLRACVTDGESLAYAVWFQRRGLMSLLKPGVELALYGRVIFHGKVPEIENPELEILDDDQGHSVGCIVPIYPTTAGLQPKWLRRLISDTLNNVKDQIVENLPVQLLEKYEFPSASEAVIQMHNPTDASSWRSSRRRLAFEEFYTLQLGLSVRRRFSLANRKALPLTGEPELLKRFLQILPFQLTEDQKQVAREISNDLKCPFPMNRLLQGDVGSGKTVVALLAILQAIDSGCQAALMAPTAVLAQQHRITLETWLKPLGLEVALLLGGQPASERKKTCEGLISGNLKLVIGTHALLQETVNFNNLGLVVIDEQHRFGVLQRLALSNKGNTWTPHTLVMTATPIPRTLALSIYGDLAVSTIRHLPMGRRPIRTVWIRSNRKPGMMAFLEKEMGEGRQVYWVCPIIEESENIDASPLESCFETLQAAYPGRRVAMLHGRLPQAEKERIMHDFAAGYINLLAATTIIEVGVDVPNATVMVIENADRFGLSQLHQLRGRVGRGEHQSWCVLLADSHGDESVQRLEALCQSSDGFQIAETDMKLRGPGEFCGVKQHGLTDFRVADILHDGDLMELARTEAIETTKNVDPFATNPNLMKTVLERYGKLLDIVRTG